MSSSLNSSNNATRPSLHFRARSGSITEVIGDIFSSLPSKFRRRPDPASSSPRDQLMQMISKITVKDIQGAQRCGTGEFGAVLMLEHPTKGKVALKQLRISGVQGGKELRRRTLREGDTWRDLNHPRVQPFLGILETPTDLYLISPYVKNGSLDEYLRQHPDADRRAFLQEAAGAIAYLHKCGIVHGDIKASSILVSDDVHALLCDFGLARSETTVTSIGLEGVGTVRFQSPELLIQGGGKTPSSDAWAFGMTIYQVLSGDITFPECSNTRMINVVANKDERPPKSPSRSPSGVSYRRVWDVADGCWQDDPARRLSMQDAHKRLDPDPVMVLLQGYTYASASPDLSPDETTSDAFSHPDLGSSASSDHLLQMISKVTVKATQGVKRDRGEGLGVTLILEHPTKTKLVLKQLRVSGVLRSDDLRRRTPGEEGASQKVKHPCLLPFLGILDTPTDFYLISPYVENGSLLEYLLKHPYANREGFLQQTAGAVAYLHECGIVHGDIKTANIFVSNDFQALLCDFGLARSDTTITSVGPDGVGTIHFQAPELLTRASGKTFASDAWAFGMTIYEVLSGNIPFPEYNTASMINAVANKDERPPKSPTQSPLGRSYDGVWGVADACWEKDPARRLSMQAAHRRLRPSLMILRGHAKEVGSLAFSPDGITIVSASQDRTIRLWDVESGSQQGEAWKGYSGCVACSPDGRTVVSESSYSHSLQPWDVALGSQRGQDWKGHTARVWCAVFSPNGRTVASASDDHTIRLWNAESGAQQGGALTGHTKPVYCVAFSPDGKTVVSGSRDNTIRLWDVNTGSQRGDAWKGHTSWVMEIAFSPNGRTVASAADDKTIRLWDAESGRQKGMASIHHPNSYVRCIAFSPDGRTIVSGSQDGIVRLWDAESCKQRGEDLKGHTEQLNSVAFSPDGRIIASASDDHTIRLWDV